MSGRPDLARRLAAEGRWVYPVGTVPGALAGTAVDEFLRDARDTIPAAAPAALSSTRRCSMTPVNIDLDTQLLRTIDRLSSEFQGIFSRETVDRFARESFASLLETAEVTTFLPLFADRFARERLKALAQAEQLMPKERPEVLFVCVHNAGRSQMAALLTTQLSGGRVDVRSAGSDPADRVNPLVVEAMAEVGIDMSAEFPKPLTDEVVRAADAVITMGCGDACPIYPGKRYEDWELPDPAEAQSIEQVRAIREEVRGRVEVLLGELGVPTGDVLANKTGHR